MCAQNAVNSHTDRHPCTHADTLTSTLTPARIPRHRHTFRQHPATPQHLPETATAPSHLEAEAPSLVLCTWWPCRLIKQVKASWRVACPRPAPRPEFPKAQNPNHWRDEGILNSTQMSHFNSNRFKFTKMCVR